MKLTDFEQYLTPYLLEKGYDYFTGGMVTSLRETDGGTWLAEVTGSAAYQVRIQLTAGRITGAICNCPHKVEHCKHIVAAIYAVRTAVNA
ncbi:SWIM zinc finger family protein [Hufsiella ginkgonis]|uniref:SWIM-type domain-containing protein n=1 Tax=Hufsiella ginkgonis TaxID=2695274 RepID=A0A7K1XVZ4_9SPHI|nr:hypothetical protein [Hufsiella ginkgonis]MXV15152.1 hypothetical protein [Hufsiella ginkgonis]